MIIPLRYIATDKLRNCESMLAAGISPSSTTLTVTTGEGVKFPSYYPFLIQIESEIVECSARSTDTLTIGRNKKGTAAATHATGTPLRAIVYSNDLDLSRIICTDGEVIVTDGEVVYDGIP